MTNGVPLRVTALAASAQLGGTERVLLDFANRAFEHDVALRVLTPRDGPLVKILNKIGVPADVVPASERLLKGSQRAGRLWSLPGALVGVVGWSRRLKAHPFVRDAQVIYTIAFKTHLAAALARLHPVLWHLHEYPPETTGAFWRWLARRVPDAMIANAEAVGEAWQAMRRETIDVRRTDDALDTSRLTSHDSRLTRRGGRVVVVVPNGVNLDRFKPRQRTGWIHERLGIPRERRLIGMPAVFARWKGQVEVTQAFELIGDEFPDAHLVIVGGSIYDTVAEREYGEELNRITGQWAIPSGLRNRESGIGNRGGGADDSRFPILDSRGQRIRMLPFQREIELTYPEFDVVVHYSLRPEPFGRVVLEAMACGVPVIAAGEGGPVEILGNGESGIGNRALPRPHRTSCGWLAPPRDVPALTDVLRQALSLPPDQLRAIGEAGRRRAEDHYSARRFAGRVAAVMKDVRRET